LPVATPNVSGSGYALDPQVQRRAWIKLAMLNRAETLGDLRVPPGTGSRR
jgi:hypothetical protein